jgi:hypothetical protein
MNQDPDAPICSNPDCNKPAYRNRLCYDCYEDAEDSRAEEIHDRQLMEKYFPESDS